MPSLAQIFQVVRNMGWRYAGFKIRFEIERRTGLFRRKFPVTTPKRTFITLSKWRETVRFFGLISQGKKELGLFKKPDIQPYKRGEYPFFHARIIDLGRNYDWITNPDTGYQYDVRKHWSEIQDYSTESGDIKYVWEKSRFSYLYDFIRYDQHTGEDHAEWVFDEISSWINTNPINCGPNYKCSQEISLRVLNWTYALYYYKNSEYLTEDLFQRIIHVIYWQIKHVHANINFSRIAVRNNHAITETLALYLCGLFYPFFPEAAEWRRKGKGWFEDEIDYQVYEDGTFLQFSMNYHRVVVQLFTWAFKTAELFGERFNKKIYEKAYKSLQFLYACQDQHTGWLSNYGSNDGALFFKLNACDFRDYRPQLNVLHVMLTGKQLYGEGDWQEDVYWFNARQLAGCDFPPITAKEGWQSFKKSGYYVLREPDTITFIRCGKHKDRPAQADNLHLDIWYQGKNLLYDGGSYKYNTQQDLLKYFMGSESHNTVMLGNNDQMLKGPRFIWYNWSQAMDAEVGETADLFSFEGALSAFTFIDKGILHLRKVTKVKGKPEWIVEDEILNKPSGLPMKQIWHALSGVKIVCKDKDGGELELQKVQGWRSDYYGIKEPADEWIGSTDSNKIKTRITLA